MLAFQRTLRPNQISAVSNGIRKFITNEQQQQLMHNYAKIMLYGNNYNTPTAMAEFAQNCCERLELPTQIHELVVSISENIYQTFGEDLQASVDQQLKIAEVDEYLDLYSEQQAANAKQEPFLDAMGGIFVQMQPKQGSVSTCTFTDVTNESEFKNTDIVTSLKKKIMELMQNLLHIFMPSTSAPTGAPEETSVTYDLKSLCIVIAVGFALGVALKLL